MDLSGWGRRFGVLEMRAFLLLLLTALCLTPRVLSSACLNSYRGAGAENGETTCVFESTCQPYLKDPKWKYNGTCAKCVVAPAPNSSLSQAIITEFSTVPIACLREIHVLDIGCRNLSGYPTFVNFSDFSEALTGLRSITVSGCNLTKDGLEGTLSRFIGNLNLSHNALESLPNTLFQTSGKQRLKLSHVVLTNNSYLKSLPVSLLNLTTIQSIWLGSQNLSCAWVATYLFPWYEADPRIFQDAHELDCKHVDDEATLSIMRFTIYGALKAKHDEKTECGKVWPACACSIYTVQTTATLQRSNFPVSFTSHRENMSITLKVDCSSRNLTQLPAISAYTRFLNVSHNRLTHLSQLQSPDYRHLGSLVAEHNFIRSIASLESTPFIKQFDVLGLSHNNISALPSSLMSKILADEVVGHGRVSLGDNYIDCDCDTAENIKRLLVIHQRKIADSKRIFCKNFDVKVVDLEYFKVCQQEDENWMSVWWPWIWVVEVLLIVMVCGKICWDKWKYSSTGILPWFSAKMPRLPCDFLIEGFKGPIHTETEGDR